MKLASTTEHPPRTSLQGSAESAAQDDLARYLPIRDYAIIGDCHGCALVSRSGSIDWCAFERFDAPPVFCRILDSGKGGFLSATPRGKYDVQRQYLDGTNILRTTFSTVNCKVHDLDNLYVVDGSFFVSSGAVNPALTIMANALRVADHIKERLR